MHNSNTLPNITPLINFVPTLIILVRTDGVHQCLVSRRERSRSLFLVGRQCMYIDITLCVTHAVKSFTELGPQLLRLPGVKYMLSKVFSQDPLERYFSHVIVVGVMRTLQPVRSPAVLQHCCNSSQCIMI